MARGNQAERHNYWPGMGQDSSPRGEGWTGRPFRGPHMPGAGALTPAWQSRKLRPSVVSKNLFFRSSSRAAVGMVNGFPPHVPWPLCERRLLRGVSPTQPHHSPTVRTSCFIRLQSS